jgi:replicative DNA helicase
MNAVTLSEPPGFFDDRQVAQLRVPPHSIEAEKSVLGSMLIDNRAWDHVGDLLVESDFYRHEHRLIFQAAVQMLSANKPADVLTVYERLDRTGQGEEVGGLEYLNALTQEVPNARNVRRYAEIVRERSVLRALVTASDEIAVAAFNPDGKTLEVILDEAQAKVMALGQTARDEDDWQEPDEGMVSFLDALQDRADGKVDYVATGLTDLDAKLDGGARPGEVVIIAGRPGMGKTAVALAIAEHMAGRESVGVGVQSMEMPKLQVQNRRVSMHSRIPYHKIRRPERMSDFEWSQMTRSVEVLRQTPFWVNDDTGLNINRLRAKARRLKRRHPELRAIVVDHAGLMEGTNKQANRSTQLGEVSRGVKGLAKELGITVFFLVQLKREVEGRANPRPMMSDLRECGDFEQDADVILFVHRPIYYKPDLGDEWKQYGEIIIAKQRDGVSGVDVPVRFYADTMQFADWPADVPVPTSKVVTAKPKL